MLHQVRSADAQSTSPGDHGCNGPRDVLGVDHRDEAAMVATRAPSTCPRSHGANPRLGGAHFDDGIDEFGDPIGFATRKVIYSGSMVLRQNG